MGDPEVRARIEAEIRKAIEEERKIQLETSRKKRTESYRAADAALARVASQLRGVRADLRARALAEVRVARESFIESALYAYVVAEGPLRKEIRARLDVAVGNGRPWKSLWDDLQARIVDEAADPRELLDLVDGLRGKVALARTLSRPENHVLLRRVLDELRKRPSLGKAPDQLTSYNFGYVFETLSALGEESYRYVAETAARWFGQYDPEARQVRFPLAVAFLPDEGVQPEQFEGFADAFSGWMREASGEQQMKQKTYSGWRPPDVDALMKQAKQVIAAPPDSKLIPSCPPEVRTRPEERSFLLCPPTHGGVVAVEIRRDGADLVAFVSWQVHEEGFEVGGKQRFPVEGFRLAATALADERRLLGTELAIRVLIDGVMYKRLSGVLRYLVSKGPVALERYRDSSPRATAGQDASAPPPGPRPDGGAGTVADVGTPGPTALALREPPSAAWSLLSAGLPLLLDDSRENDWAGTALTTGETAGLAAAAVFFLRAKESRDDYAGQMGSLATADHRFGRAVSFLLLAGAIKVAGIVISLWLHRSTSEAAASPSQGMKR